MRTQPVLLALALLCAAGAALSGCSDEPASAGSSDTGGRERPGQDAGGGADTGGNRDLDDDAAPSDDTGDDDAGPEPSACTPGDRRCAGVLLQACSQDAVWVDTACSGELICRPPGVCVPETSPTGDECDPENSDPELSTCAGDEVCVDGLCRSRACSAAASSASYLGCDYLATDLPNLAYSPFGGTPDSPLGVVLANASTTQPAPFSVYAATGEIAQLVAETTITAPNLPFQPSFPPVTLYSSVLDADGAVTDEGFANADGRVIPPGGMAVILLPHRPAVTRSSISRSAFRIRTEAPVAAYQFGPYCCNFSYANDASLLLPIPTLGTDYVFVGVPSWRDVSTDGTEVAGGYPASISIVASRPDTAVQVDLPPGASVIPEGGAGRVQIRGQRVTAFLQANEVMHLLSSPPPPSSGGIVGVDLTGARVQATWPIAVFSAHECSFYPQEYGACDHLEEQLFPVDTWGTDFALVPPVLRTRQPASATEAVYWKIVAERDDTRIELSVPFASLSPREPGFVGVADCADRLEGDSTLVLRANESCEFGTRAPVALESTYPIQVMGIISGQNTTGFSGDFFGQHAGDPAIYLVPPVRQFRTDYSFLAPTTYFNDFVTVVSPPDGNMTLDGESVDMRTGVAVPGRDLVYRHLPIEDGPHALRSTRPFGILVFAYDDYVSYAFTGGLNLIKTAEE